MPTINSMVLRNSTIASVSNKYFRADTEAAQESILISAPLKTNSDFLKSDFGGQPALTTMVENYSAEKDDFKTKMQDKLESLRASSDKLQETVGKDSAETVAEKTSDTEITTTLSKLGEFTKDNVPPRAKILAFQPKTERRDDEQIDFERYLETDETDEIEKQEEPVEKPSDNPKIASIQDFVRSYNSTVSYLNENRAVSDKISTLADNFENSRINQSLGNIGISVNAQGRLSVNEDKLSTALEDDSAQVNELVGRINKVINLAGYRSENLFPTIEEYADKNDFEDWEQLYSAKNPVTVDYSKSSSGKLLDFRH